MEKRGFASQKISGRTVLIILIVVSIPAFFWFHFLYDTYVVDKVSPTMAKMRDATMHKIEASSAAEKGIPTKKSDNATGEKGAKENHR